MVDPADRARRERTAWVPCAEVRRVETREEQGVETHMEALSALADGAAVRAALGPIATAYAAWIEKQAASPLESDERRDTRFELLLRADTARRRIDAGVELLATDEQVRDAFKLANEAMALAARQRNPERYKESDPPPKWRLFQLPFVLLSLRGIAVGGRDDASEADRKERDQVELIFFPTGGGKTEAYLGVIALTLVLRRLRGQTRPDRGLGVAVLLRYTLRLLTLDQFGRAATLICALETLRRRDPSKLGAVRFAVGLWVGKSATANTLAEVQRLTTEYKANPTRPSPCPLTACPWCREPLGPDSSSTLARIGPPPLARRGRLRIKPPILILVL